MDTSQLGRLEGRKLTDDTVTSVDNGDNFEDFEAKFYGTETPEESAPSEPEDQVEEAEEIEEDADLGEAEDSESEEADEPAESDEDEEDEQPAPKKNKVPASKRIEQLNRQLRETERREAEYARRIEALEAAIQEKAKEEQTPLRDQLPDEAPNPDAKMEDGETPKYPLGEFDPQYIADLTQHTIDTRMKAAEEKRQQEEQARQFQQEREQLANQWTERLDKYEEQVPEVRENIRELTDTFQTLDAGYGEYLASVLMSMDSGPQVMDYLSQNIGEAKEIVNLGPALATVALGRLDAILSPKKQEPVKKNKTSAAPPPPEDRTRGSNGKFAVRPDTDNLDAFEKEFFS